MLREFKQFLLRGNVVDLAVGVVIGSAFGAVVSALVSDFLTPFISTVARIPDLSGLTFAVGASKFAYGHFINTFISFVLIAATIFFFVVKPMNVLISRSKRGAPADPATKKCSECCGEIRIEARRCMHCTQLVS